MDGPRREDICYATTSRQAAIKVISLGTDLVLVIGSASSSNSQRLREVAERSGGGWARLIPDATALDWSELEGVTTLGLSSGASAPELLVDAPLSRLSERFRPETDERRVVQEDVVSKLPAPLAD